MFEPIDHKDSDADYRRDVRQAVESQYGELKPTPSRSELVGSWIHSLYSNDGTPYRLHEDGTVSCQFDSDTGPKGRWSFEDDRFTSQTWCEPTPEYGLDEGAWDEAVYHCMMTGKGTVVLWNGDGSLIMTLTPKR